MAMKVLVYGSIDSSEESYDEVCRALERLLREFMRRGWQVITREGESAECWDRSCWKAVDNIVLTVACAYRDGNGLNSNVVSSFCDADEYQAGKVSEHKRPMILLPVSDRLIMYKHMLDESDAMVTVGGREGVARISIVSRILGVPTFPLNFTGGASRRVYREIAAGLSPPETMRDLAQLWRDVMGKIQGPSNAEEAVEFADAIERLIGNYPGTPRPVKRDEDVTKLRVRDLLGSLTITQIAAVVAALASIFGAGYFLGSAN